jgi:hypothetical protein
MQLQTQAGNLAREHENVTTVLLFNDLAIIIIVIIIIISAINLPASEATSEK